jgi:D-alanyl-D-alanine dipeptidase
MDDAARRVFDDRRVFTYRELAAVPVTECGDAIVPMVDDAAAGIRIGKLDSPWVRAGVFDRLRAAARALRARDPSLHLKVVSAHRMMARQRAAYAHYTEQFGRKHPHLDAEALAEFVHQHVAVPSVAGHPTGGAIDLTLANEAGEVDMGAAYGDFSNQLFHAFAEGLTEAQRANRALLREVMVGAGFAPFNGEWWHFSYGDAEWAAVWTQPTALFRQIEDPEKGI